MSNVLVTPKVLTCPADSRKPATDFRSLTTNHLSYFLNMDATSTRETNVVLNGDRHIEFTPAPRDQVVTITTNLSIGWAKKLGHAGIGNVALVDGSVAKPPNRELTEMLLAPSRVSAHRLLFP